MAPVHSAQSRGFPITPKALLARSWQRVLMLFLPDLRTLLPAPIGRPPSAVRRNSLRPATPLPQQPAPDSPAQSLARPPSSLPGV